ncbi:MAG TPA: type II toxin-antitoxin system HicA family toxin [Thioploca sp.]|nr:MAG: type II toxin-antitoxin system HicA family toxin [Gammaproteobacteria bacterium]HDN27877.1 type II toxin-antitoxin system HicA family toxin [Thioploca sp.]
MSKREKLIARFVQMPTDFSWDELTQLLRGFDYDIETKGKTSGSRVRFIHDDYPPIDLHKPHPSNVLKRYQMQYLDDFLSTEGLYSEVNDDTN